MNRKSLETGKKITKIMAIVSVFTCLAALLAQEGSVLQFALALLTLALFVLIFIVVAVYCRCPHCGKAIFFGVWKRTTCPHCNRNLITGKKAKGRK